MKHLFFQSNKGVTEHVMHLSCLSKSTLPCKVSALSLDPYLCSTTRFVIWACTSRATVPMVFEFYGH